MTAPSAAGGADDAGAPNKTKPLRVLRNAVLQIILLGLAVHLIVPQITSLEHSLAVLRAMNRMLVGLAVAAQIASYVGTGDMVRSLAAVAGKKVGVARGVAVTLAASSVGTVGAGALGYAAATFHWLARDIGDEAAGLTAALTPLLNNAVVLGVAVLGVALRLARFGATPEQAGMLEVTLGMLVVAVAAVALVARRPLSLADALDRLAGRVAAARGRVRPPHRIRSLAAPIVENARRLRRGGWRRPMLGAALNIGFDMLTLWLLFAASGHAVSPDVLCVGYGLPILVGKVGLLPGGIGVVEASMTAIYAGLGVPAGVVVVVVLGYRLLSFWLPLAIGFPMIGVVERAGDA
ncbi:MAG: flippase-like domain-containing protein [Ardenticatenales bacterium]